MKYQHYYVGFEANEFTIFTAIPLIANVIFGKYRIIFAILLLAQLAVVTYFKLQWKKNACEDTHLNFVSAALLSSAVGLFLSWVNLALYLAISSIVIVVTIPTIPLTVFVTVKMAQYYILGKGSQEKKTKTNRFPTALGAISTGAATVGLIVAKCIYSTTGDASILLYILGVGCYLLSLLFVFSGLSPIAKKIINRKSNI